jgi:hypothetical protein
MSDEPGNRDPFASKHFTVGPIAIAGDEQSFLEHMACGTMQAIQVVVRSSFTDIGQVIRNSDIGEVEKLPPNREYPGLECYAFDARAIGDRFAVDVRTRFTFGRQIGRWKVDIDFEDSSRWEAPASERIVGRVMQGLYRFVSQSWFQTHGGWRHGVFFTCRHVG